MYIVFLHFLYNHNAMFTAVAVWLWRCSVCARALNQWQHKIITRTVLIHAQRLQMEFSFIFMCLFPHKKYVCLPVTPVRMRVYLLQYNHWLRTLIRLVTANEKWPHIFSFGLVKSMVVFFPLVVWICSFWSECNVRCNWFTEFHWVRCLWFNGLNCF